MGTKTYTKSEFLWRFETIQDDTNRKLIHFPSTSATPISTDIFTFQSAVGIELWSMSQDILFDNLLITDDFVVAQEWASLTFDLKRKQIDRESVSVRCQNWISLISPRQQEQETIHDTTMRSINNKPFWWTVYVIYCMIPVVIYAWYLWRRTLEVFDCDVRHCSDK